ncbi:PHP domain-containing protein [Georgenia sp. Z1344]|uniref:PHP domain-containing protein n=1 Tax=Georgenia sp. Z1344 TaxID=3416706 RepID=UPI003CF3EE11
MGARYAELHAHSAFSFLDGANLPEDLAAEAARLGLEALALTDHDGLPGVVRLAEAARTLGLPTVIGAELGIGSTGRTSAAAGGGTHGLGGPADPDGEHLLVLARGREGYARLSAAISRAHLATGVKGRARYDLAELADTAAGQWMILTGCRKGAVRRALEPERGRFAPASAARELARLAERFGRDNVAVEITDTGDPLDQVRSAALAQLAEDAGLPLVATGGVHCARPQDVALAHVMAATRARASLEEIDGWLPAAPAHLRSAEEMLSIHRHHPHAVTAAADLAAELAFDLRLVAPDLPPHPVPPGHTEATWLRELTHRGAERRYGPRGAERIPGAWDMIDHELEIIDELGFPGYFLIVHQIVDFCVENGILCQGRGSAANSAVCFALGITAVDAVTHRLLFERFLSPGRSGPPDIDLDIESGRREEVIQFVFERYGREHAAQVANVIAYRPRSAVRDAARALGHGTGQQDAWAKSVERWGSLRTPDAGDEVPDAPSGTPAPAASSAPATPEDPRWPGTTWWDVEQVGRSGVAPVIAPEAAPPSAPAPGADDVFGIPGEVVDIAEQLLRLPRHLGIHSGGVVLCSRPVIEVCPVQWATMPGRTVLQWDKDDCADAGLVKFDLLGLGMLTALRLAFTELTDRGVRGVDGRPLGLHNLPQDDDAVYDLLCAADTVGVFQVESRAQMATLPRLRPRTFYDLVVEVALIRPGPIQGNSVNPYINRRLGREPVTYLHDLLRPALEKTLGVPLFQEQLMQIAMDAASFTPAEADQLRKAMGAKRSEERMEALHARLIEGMAGNGIDRGVGEQIFDKLKAFADFGFPESHSFSFAYLVYASAWLKVHHPEAFYAAILGAQPMGFYSPQTLVADARRHGVRVQRASINGSSVHASVVVAPEGHTPTPDDDTPGGVAPVESVARLVRPDPGRAIRLGLAAVRGVGEEAAERIVAERDHGGPYASIADLAGRVDLTTAQLEALATAGALDLGGDRRQALWTAGALAGAHGTTRRSSSGERWIQPPLPGTTPGVSAPELPGMTEVETAVADVWATGVSPGTYPTQYRRADLDDAGVLRLADLPRAESGRRVRAAGVVTHRQRPHTARGVTFLSLEDETGLANVVCSAGVWARYRQAARTSAALVIRGIVERADGVTNLVADQITPLSLSVSTTSRDFR